ncbi:general transcription factor II-I repeat domain-containing protein 2 [Trichonephila inaurata madagascariensis]|uniref:General transcription factor II-I repeat domain-containing protein 2 n=1 Tax=Trichonephila inaurata madagascariensis TaxID=2747483 RepID=A0A8X6XIY3_9ARAC|nr:general transcription factor II-I repeat domain-containing protein 2 [Trichonephila inaurata madagascariensis]
MEKPLWEGSIVFRLDKGDAQRLIENVRLSCGALEEESSKKITTSVLQADPYNWTRTSWSETFKDKWNFQYFVIESSNKALCLIRNETIDVLKKYNIKRHYESKHLQNYSKYTGSLRTEQFEALKRGLKSQQSLFTKANTEQESATRASFRVALEIAKRGKPFTDREMIKECLIAVAEEICPEKVNLFKSVSLSANTVARRVQDIAENISSQLSDKNGHHEWFSLALDESTDVSQILLRC